jgi:hypothetical protein
MSVEKQTVRKLNKFLKDRGGLADGTAYFFTHLENNIMLYGRVLCFKVAAPNLTFRINAEFEFKGTTYHGIQPLSADAMRKELKLPNSDKRAQKFDSRGRVYILFKSVDGTRWLAAKVRDVLTRDVRQGLTPFQPPDETVARDAAEEHSIIHSVDHNNGGIVTKPTPLPAAKRNGASRRRTVGRKRHVTSRTSKLLQQYESVLRRVSGKASGTEAIKHMSADKLATVLSLTTLEANQIHSHASRLTHENSAL